MQEENAYILGTDTQELYRLGVQHQVWAEEAHHGWRLAQFRAGQTLLDLGSGPGFCTKEMAYLVGQEGKVIGVDLSPAFIEHLKRIKELYQLNIEPVLADFNQMSLKDNSLDGMYCRWALAWLSNPQDILQKVYKALKPGGRMVIHEYYDWSTHKTQPPLPGLKKAITAALKSFKDSEAEIDIGRELPQLLTTMGMKINSIRLMSKLATPDSVTWEWPKTFYHSYYPRLVDAGYLSEEDVSEAINNLKELEQTVGASISCPMMVEVIAEKI